MKRISLFVCLCVCVCLCQVKGTDFFPENVRGRVFRGVDHESEVHLA